ncbi:MAG: hypothetical protein V1726_05615 [Methanobacteriota archaeon]
MIRKINRKIAVILLILMIVCVTIATVSLAKFNYSKGDPDDVDNPSGGNELDFRVNNYLTIQNPGEGGDADEYFL